MKRALIFVVALTVSGCWGTWSNDDLEYINALPTKDTLEGQPGGTTGQPLSGAATKQQGLFGSMGHAVPLNVGDPSEGFNETVSATKALNTMIDFIVGVVAFIETVPPTTRTKTSRVWGPFPDKDHPGFDLRITVNKADASHFTYTFEWRKSGGAYFSLVDGAATATANLHRGQGQITIHSQAARENLGGWDGIDELDLGYDTSTFPTAVDVTAVASNNAGTVEWVYQQAKDTSGRLQFTLRPDPTATNGGLVEAQAISFWLSDGSGEEVGSVTQGTWTGAHGTECWDAARKVTYQIFWDGTEHGMAASCPATPFSP